MQFENWNGWMVLSGLELPPDGGIKAELMLNGRWEPACLFPNLTEEILFEPNNNQDWNWATEYRGLVPASLIRDDRVYWNYCVNFAGVPEPGGQRLRITRFAAGGRVLSVSEHELFPEPGDTVILNNWREWEGAPVHTYSGMEPNRQHDPADAEPGWTVANCMFGQPRLTFFGTAEVPPLSFCPGLEGEYELYLCIKEELLECTLELPGQSAPEWVFLRAGIIPFNKFWKEIRIGRYQFRKNDRITIRRSETSRFNALRRFGDLFYLKLVPAASAAPVRNKLKVRCPDITFYSEPYTLAYLHLLQNEEMAETVADIYASLGVKRIVAQMGRIGSFTLYPSRVGVRGRAGAIKGDDQQYSNGAEEMMANLDILALLPRLCRERGILFSANMAVNSPYRGSPLEAKFSMEHPEYFHHHLLDFERPEVVDFAAEHFREMAEYDIDGLDVSHTRWPYYQTAESIIAFHRRIVEKIGWKRRKELQLSMSFVADDPDYYRAVETLLEEDLIDVLTPGRLMCLYPEVNLRPYIELAHRRGKKVYALLDGWGCSYSGMNTQILPRPDEFRKLAETYLAQGADGIYFYQSEQILSSPFMKRVVRELQEE